MEIVKPIRSKLNLCGKRSTWKSQNDLAREERSVEESHPFQTSCCKLCTVSTVKGHLHNGEELGRWHSLQSPETDPHGTIQPLCPGAEAVEWGNTSISNKVLESWTFTAKEKDPHCVPHAKSNSKWVPSLNVRGKSMKRLEGNRRNVCYLG